MRVSYQLTIFRSDEGPCSFSQTVHYEKIERWINEYEDAILYVVIARWKNENHDTVLTNTFLGKRVEGGWETNIV